MTIDLSLTTLATLLLVSTRVCAWAMLAPPLATGGIPRTVTVLLSMAIGLAMLGVARPQAPSLDIGPFTGALLMQVLIGAALGFLTKLLFTAIEAAGSMLDFFAGFSMSQSYDPVTGSMHTVIGKFYAILAGTLIFATNAHLLIFGGFLRSFTAIPLNATMSLGAFGHALAHGTSEMFLSALQIAGPLIIVLFVADIGIGVLNRIAPQLNAFTMSFPIKIGLTLLLLGVGLTLMPDYVTHIANRVNTVIGSVIG